MTAQLSSPAKSTVGGSYLRDILAGNKGPLVRHRALFTRLRLILTSGELPDWASLMGLAAMR